MSQENVTRRISIYVNGKEVENSLKGVDGAVVHLRNQLRQLDLSTEEGRRKQAELTAEYQRATQTQSQYREELGLTRRSMDESVGLFGRLKNSIGSVASGMLAAFSIAGAASAFAGAIKEAFKTINDFEQGVADLSAITGATGKNLEYLKDQAIELGKTTQGGAIQVLDAYKLIASAKPELLDNASALNAVTAATITLAQAAGMEMPAAATALTDAMNQFGADANQASIFVDALANGAKYGAAEIPQVTEALLKFGAVARSSNVSIQESTALVELLAENGLKGADAGTALRNVLLKLSAPDALPKEAKAEMEKLGISMTFLKDKTVPVQEKLEALKPLLKDNASIVKIFGTENSTAAINIIGHTDRLEDLTSKMGEMGTATQQAAIKMDTVKGQTELMKSTYDSLILSIGSGSGVVSGFFKFFAKGATDMLNGLIRLNTSWDDLKNKSIEKGTQSGKSIFQERLNSLKGTGSNADISGSIKTTAFKDYQRLQKEYLINEQKIKDFNPYALNLGESGKDLQKKREQLAGDLAEQRTIIRESLKVINADTQTAANEKNKIITEGAAVLTDSEQKARDKQEAEKQKSIAKEIKSEKEKNKEIADNALALANAKADLSKAELANFISNERSKLDATKLLTPEIIQEETNRLERIKERQLTALVEDRLAKVEKAEREGKSAEEIAALKQAIDYDYETNRQALELGFQVATDGLKKQYIDEQKVAQAEQLQIDNDLAIAEAATKEEADKIKRDQDYNNQLSGYKKLFDDKKITEEEYDRFKAAAKVKQDDMDRVAQIQKVQGTLGGLNQLAGAVTELFGQSKEMAIVQAGINGAMAVTSILAQYPKFDGGFAMTAALIAAGISTAAQIAKITKAKPAKTPKFFYGGSTGTTAHLGYDEYGPMTGIVHKNEYVIPEVMTQSPRYANTIAWLEQERTERLPRFANGGATSPGVVATGSMGAVTDNEMKSMLSALLFRLNNPIAPNLKIGYTEAQDIQTLNDERTASTNNGTLSN